jgi:catechol 2,3-dioxygenase-like lactoylglutathione lyase family enzyme
MSRPFESTRDVMIEVAEPEEALRFYKDVMGLELFESNARYAGLEAGGFRLFVERGSGFGPVFEFKVPDLDAAKRRLLAAGCRIVEEDPKVPRLYMRDPYGLTFNLDRR